MNIAMSVPLAERSEAAIGEAIEVALETAVREAMATGWPSVELVSVRMGAGHLDVRVRALVADEGDR